VLWRAAAAVTLLAACSNGATPHRPPGTTSTAAAPARAAARCSLRETMRVEVDGDGLPDLAFHAWVGDGAVLGVCLGSGGYAQAEGIGMSELMAAFDVDGDGRDELLAGGTTATWGEYTAFRYDRGALRRTDLTLAFGIAPAAAFGCHGRVLVQVDVDRATGVVRTTHPTFAGPGPALRSRLPEGAEPAAYAASLVRPCAGLRER
jgi:hypothetical protein